MVYTQSEGAELIIASLNGSQHTFDIHHIMIQSKLVKQKDILPPLDECHGFIANPHISPDGTFVAFWLTHGRHRELWLLDTQTLHFESLFFDQDTPLSYISWSPDSTHLAFQHAYRFDRGPNQYPTVDSYLLDIETREAIHIADSTYSNILWHPSKPIVAYSTKADDTYLPTQLDDYFIHIVQWGKE